MAVLVPFPQATDATRRVWQSLVDMAGDYDLSHYDTKCTAEEWCEANEILERIQEFKAEEAEFDTSEQFFLENFINYLEDVV